MAKARKKGSKRASSTRSRVGRPSSFTKKLANRICALIASGKSDLQTCEAVGIARDTLWRWEEQNEQFHANSTHARVRRAETIADELITICDNSAKPVDERRLMVDTRLRLLGKLLPKQYGDKVGVEHSGAVGLSVTIVRRPQ